MSWMSPDEMREREKHTDRFVLPTMIAPAFISYIMVSCWPWYGKKSPTRMTTVACFFGLEPTRARLPAVVPICSSGEVAILSYAVSLDSDQGECVNG